MGKVDKLKKKLSEGWIIFICATIVAILIPLGFFIYSKMIEKLPNTVVVSQTLDDGFSVVAKNDGDAPDTLTITISVGNRINSAVLYPLDDIKLINGRVDGRANYAVFQIDSLMPRTWKSIVISSQDKTPVKLIAWSKYTGDIKVYKGIEINYGPSETRSLKE